MHSKKSQKKLERRVFPQVGTRFRFLGLSPTLIVPVAIAYVMQKTPYVFPIVGGRKVEHLMQNIEALSISLSPEQITYLESIIPFEPGFPNYMIVSIIPHTCSSSDCSSLVLQGDGRSYSVFMTSTANLDKQPLLQPIRPTKE